VSEYEADRPTKGSLTDMGNVFIHRSGRLGSLAYSRTSRFPQATDEDRRLAPSVHW